MVLCPLCHEQLQESFDFKIHCLNNDTQLKILFNSEEMDILILEQLDPKLNLVENVMFKTEITKVCRFCFKQNVMEDCTALDLRHHDIFFNDLIRRTFPELVRIYFISQ